MEVTVDRWAVALHVVIAFWFVAGLVGRDVALARARATDDLAYLRAVVDLAARFESWMVRPGSIAVLVAGLLAAWAQDRPLAGGGNRWLLVSIVLFLSLAPNVPLVFLPRGRVFERSLADAVAAGHITDELRASLRDRAVAAARVYESAVVVVIVVLMVTKPF